jgi:hypothetical protein
MMHQLHQKEGPLSSSSLRECPGYSLTSKERGLNSPRLLPFFLHPQRIGCHFILEICGKQPAYPFSFGNDQWRRPHGR